MGVRGVGNINYSNMERDAVMRADVGWFDGCVIVSSLASTQALIACTTTSSSFQIPYGIKYIMVQLFQSRI